MKNNNLITLEIIEMIRQYDMKSSVLCLHSFHVSALIQDLAVNLGLVTKDKPQSYWWLTGLVHDAGKLSIPTSILCKRGAYTTEEMAIMQPHATYSRDRLLAIEPFAQFAEAAYQHHEKWDGSGYPRGLRANEMTLEAKLLAVVDKYEAMSSIREYRPVGMPLFQILQMLMPEIRVFFGEQCGIVRSTLIDYHRQHRIQRAEWHEDRTVMDQFTSLPRAAVNC